MRELETDYLVVGAGASGMAFTDTLIDHADADVVLVDRRHAPGGHWNDAYPFVRLHQPSAYYGVASRVLGTESIDQTGPNAGFYDRATGAEICAYYQRVLEEHLLASGQVRFLGMHDHVADPNTGHRLVSRLTGETTTVRARRRVVDATWLESSVPARHERPFDVDADARVVTPDELVRTGDPAVGYTVIGGGKTAMDTCDWLLGTGVDPDAIRWIRPQDTWTLDRRYFQPLSRVPWLLEGYGLLLEAAAQAGGVGDLFHRLEASGYVLRLDPDVEPGAFRGATLSLDELERLRGIEHVVREGYVRRIGTHQIVMTEGTLPTDPGQIHVDCTARGLGQGAVRSVFEPGRITIQWIQWGVLPFSTALIAFLEATRDDDEDRNHLCPVGPPLGGLTDAARAFAQTQRGLMRWQEDPEVSAWRQDLRLNVARGAIDHLDDPRMQSALTRLGSYGQAAVDNLDRLAEAR